MCIICINYTSSFSDPSCYPLHTSTLAFPRWISQSFHLQMERSAFFYTSLSWRVYFHRTLIRLWTRVSFDPMFIENETETLRKHNTMSSGDISPRKYLFFLAANQARPGSPKIPFNDFSRLNFFSKKEKLIFAGNKFIYAEGVTCVCICLHVYTYSHIHVYIHVYIYIYI